MLTKFRLVKTDGLKGLFYKGRHIPFDKIDDTMAAQLIGKTHMLERVPETEAAPQLALDSAEPATGAEPAAGAEEPATTEPARQPATTEPAPAEAEAPASGRKQRPASR